MKHGEWFDIGAGCEAITAIDYIPAEDAAETMCAIRRGDTIIFRRSVPGALNHLAARCGLVPDTIKAVDSLHLLPRP